jgi:membrane protease YdiL (CAAX protease family)
MNTMPALANARHMRFLSRPVTAFFLLAFALSWGGAFCLVARYLFRGQPIPKFSGLMMFPVMLLGPSVAGLLMTWRSEGTAGLRKLFRRMVLWRFSPRWYGALLIPAALILTTLAVLASLVSPAYRPNLFLIGSAFGLMAGFFEETGWTGFAFPALCRARSPFAAAILLGLAWSAWHIPVIDYLGTATPHGAWWLEYFLAFSFAMVAMRVLISWLFARTGSLLLAQLMHAASTGALVVLSPSRVSAAQESQWYAAYGSLLWLVVAVVHWSFGPGLKADFCEDEPGKRRPNKASEASLR